jgi:hypothetical protein
MIARILNKNWLIFSVFWASLLLFYAPVAHAGFVTDWLGWETRYREMGWSGVPNCFGYNGLLHVGQAIFYAVFWIFGRNGWAWLIIMTGLHALNSWLGWRLFIDIFEKSTQKSIDNSAKITLLGGSILFLVSPYAVETIVWRVCLHYLFLTTFLLIGLRAAVSFLEKNERKSLILSWLCFLAAMFSLEIALVFPVMLSLLVLGWAFATDQKNRLGGWMSQLVLPGIAGWFLFFCLNKFLLGAWVGHYGADTHFKVKMTDMISTAFKYVAKNGAFLRYFDHEIKEKQFARFDESMLRTGLIFFFLALFVAAIFSFFRKKAVKNPHFFGWAGVSMGWFFLALAPACNLFFYWISWGENDRYGYFPLFFWWLFLSILVLFLPKIVRFGLFFTAFGVSIFFLKKTIDAWRDNDLMQTSLIENFRWWDEKRVIILGCAENYKGTYGFRLMGGASGFREALEQSTGRKFGGTMLEVAQFNQQYLTDGIRAKRNETGDIDVSFAQYGNWWWTDGVTKFNENNPFYSIKFGEWLDYHLTEKPSSDGSKSVFIYQNGLNWELLVPRSSASDAK